MQAGDTRLRMYYPGMNGMRFMAVLLVMVSHTVVFTANFGYPELWSNAFSTHLGASGVTLFFVLSGFLITSLLLKEKETTGQVRIGAFYLRRVLRIWPLYYLFLIVSAFLLPLMPLFQMEKVAFAHAGQFAEEMALYALMLPNVVFVWYPLLPFTHVLWSVGVEEQFYLFWPHVVRRTQVKNLLWVMAALALVWMMLKATLTGINWVRGGGVEPLAAWVNFLGRTRFVCMILGGGFAWLLARKSPLLSFLFHPATQWVSLLLLTALVCYSDGVPVIDQELIALFGGILMLSMAANPRRVLSLENRFFHYTGKISYGLYIWHTPVLVACGKLLKGLIPAGSTSEWMFLPLLLTMTLLVTAAVAHLSWHYFEAIFLRMRRKHTTIVSGEDAKGA